MKSFIYDHNNEKSLFTGRMLSHFQEITGERSAHDDIFTVSLRVTSYNTPGKTLTLFLNHGEPVFSCLNLDALKKKH